MTMSFILSKPQFLFGGRKDFKLQKWNCSKIINEWCCSRVSSLCFPVPEHLNHLLFPQLLFFLVLGKKLIIIYYKLLQSCQHTEVVDICHNGQNASSTSLEIRSTTAAQTQGFLIINLTRKAWFFWAFKPKNIFSGGVCALGSPFWYVHQNFNHWLDKLTALRGSFS